MLIKHLLYLVFLKHELYDLQIRGKKLGTKTNKLNFVGIAGLVSLSLLVSLVLAPTSSVSAATYTVTNTNDSGAGSFRQAIADANANAGADQVNFNIAGTGPHTITLTSGSLVISGPTTINGLSQPGSVCDGSDTELMIRLDLNGNVNPMYFDSGAVGGELNGLALANAGENAYAFNAAAADMTIRCNFFGTYDGENIASTEANSDYVIIDAPGVTVGGDAQTDMNLSLAPATSNHRFSFNSSATDINFRNNIVGVTLNGTTAVGGGNAALIIQGSPTSTVIANNLLYSDAAGAAVMFTGSNRQNVDISGNTIGLNKSGTSAFSNASSAIAVYGTGSDMTIYQNHLASTKQKSTIDFSNATNFDDVAISGNKINVTTNGATAIGGSGDGNRAINTVTQAEGVFYDNWEITDNHMYGNSLALMLYDFNELLMTNNIVGMEVSRTGCFESAARSVIMLSKEVMVGGTDQADANAFCGTSESIGSQSGLELNSSRGTVTVLGNKIISDEYQPLSMATPIFNTPTIIAVNESGGSTDITFRVSNSAGDWRAEFFENTELRNTGGYPNARTFAGSTDITTAGGPEELTVTLPATDLENLSMTITEKDGSADGLGRTSVIAPSALEADLAVSTTDGMDTVFEGTNNHAVTQTFTNTGPNSVTDITFYEYADCFGIHDSVSTSGTATDVGSYTPGPYGSSIWSGVLESGQSLVLTFTSDVGCGAGDTVAFNHDINEIHYRDYLISNTSASVDTGDDTGIIGYSAAVNINTSDSVDTVQYDATNHQITQSLYNGGSNSISNISFNLAETDCFSITGATANFGSYDLGTHTWVVDSLAPGDVFHAGRTLAITFTGEISCDPGDTMNFTHEISTINYDGHAVTDVNDENDFTDSTNIIGPTVDLEIETTDSTDSVLSYAQNHEITQTFTNNGPSTIALLAFTTNDYHCFGLNGVSTGGSATDTGSYNDDTSVWEGLLEPGQSLVLTFTVDIECYDGEMAFDQSVNNIKDQFATVVVDSTNDNNDYSDTSQIVVPVSDTAVAQTLTNPEDVAVGETLEYDVTFTNQGPQPIDISQYDGTFGEFGPNSLLYYFIPPELDYIGFSSEDDVTCTSFGPGSASMFGSSLGNHSDWEIIMCYESSGSENILNEDDFVSATIQVSPNETSDLDFTNYAYGSFGQNDPDVATMGGLGSNDIVDYLTANPINNFVASLPMVDAAIIKTLVGEGSATPGDTVAYNMAIENKGPMSFNLNLIPISEGLPMFVDIYPADSLSYVGTNNEDFACQDLGPGSAAFLGNAAMDHPDYQLLICGFAGDSQIFSAGETLNVQLQFEVIEGASLDITNYALISTLPTDPDTQYLNNEFANSQEDVLDVIDNENFSKVSYTADPPADGDGDGIVDSIEDDGPNGGDANNDGTLDSEQEHVSSFINSVTNNPVVLEVSEDCSVSAVDMDSESSNSIKDQDYTYPLGLMSFTLECANPGYIADITQYYFNQDLEDYVLRKYNPINDEYFNIQDATVDEQTIASSSVVTASYQVQDGSDLDIDGSEDGNISDPAGLATQATDDSGNESSAGGGVLGQTGFNLWLIANAALALLLVSVGVIWYLRKSRK